MIRIKLEPRSNFVKRAEEIGFNYASIDGQAYWNESAAYVFSLRQIEDDIEAPSEELAALSLSIIPNIISSEELLTKLAIPKHAWSAISDSWARREPSLYGRFDFSYDGKSPAKLLEYNADTPTSLFESAVVQWFWLKDLVERGDLPPHTDQYNSIHEALIARWRDIAKGRFVHLACMSENIEDIGNVAYLNECAVQAGLQTKLIDISDIGVLGNQFMDRENVAIKYAFKLYPWEWMLLDAFGRSAAMKNTQFIEPLWKMLFSNKGFLALLWEAEPNHPNLLPCYFETDCGPDVLGDCFARKPLFSREGANVTLMNGDSILAQNSGVYGSEGYVKQKLHLLPDFDGKHPVIGSWIVGNKAVGMGIREDVSLITSNKSCFVPHYILD
jgi:glutathionylspermidine synthase